MLYIQKKITSLPLNNILAEGITFRRERKRMGFQIFMGDELIWDYPFEFIEDTTPVSKGMLFKHDMWYGSHMSDLHRFLRRYVDTPRDKLDDIEGDYVGLRDILLAADKRRGRHVNATLLFTTNSAKARKIIHYRFGRKQREA